MRPCFTIKCKHCGKEKKIPKDVLDYLWAHRSDKMWTALEEEFVVLIEGKRVSLREYYLNDVLLRNC